MWTFVFNAFCYGRTTVYAQFQRFAVIVYICTPLHFMALLLFKLHYLFFIEKYFYIEKQFLCTDCL